MPKTLTHCAPWLRQLLTGHMRLYCLSPVLCRHGFEPRVHVSFCLALMGVSSSRLIPTLELVWWLAILKQSLRSNSFDICKKKTKMLGKNLLPIQKGRTTIRATINCVWRLVEVSWPEEPHLLDLCLGLKIFFLPLDQLVRIELFPAMHVSTV